MNNFKITNLTNNEEFIINPTNIDEFMEDIQDHGCSGLTMSENFTASHEGWWMVENDTDYPTEFICEILYEDETSDDMQKFLVDISKFSNEDHKIFYTKWNAKVTIAWNRTDDKLTKISAGYYVARINNQIHECTKRVGDGWLENNQNENICNYIETLSDFRKWAAETNTLQ
jgi:hypothetical protein